MKAHSRLCSPLSLPARLALCVGIGAALAVSLDPATGIALGGALFLVFQAVNRRG